MGQAGTEKHGRVLDLYHRFLEGETIRKKEEAQRFGVSEKSIERDIADINAFFAERRRNGGNNEVRYCREENGYRLYAQHSQMLEAGEAFAICKILLASRGLVKEEMFPVLDKIVRGCVPKRDVAKIGRLLGNEKLFYLDLQHGKPLIDRVWSLSGAVQEQKVTWVRYVRMDGQKVERAVEPVGILFSEFYFYLAAYVRDIDKNAFENKDDTSPTIYRIDRIEDVNVSDEHFAVPYKDKFKEGEFRKRIQFMQGGKLQRVYFEYSGPSVEAVLDRLPTAEILSEQDGVYQITAEVFGKGIDMWFRSQGEYLKVK